MDGLQSQSDAVLGRIGRYTILAELARGGMSQVMIAQRDGSPDICVLKQLLGELKSHEIAEKRFFREAQLAAYLDHPRIARVIDAGFEDDTFCIAMEHIAGCNVEELVRASARHGQMLPYELSLALVLGALEGLEYAHDARDPAGQPLELIHRDLSPRNLMLSFDGQVKIIDFGVARGRVDDFRTEPGMIVGTLRYVSPEQAVAEPLDRRSDLYSLSVVLYELLTGRALIPDGSPIEVLSDVLHRPTRPLSSLNPDLPLALDPVLIRALAKDPADRFPDARSLRLALEAAAGELGRTPRAAIGEYVAAEFPEACQAARALEQRARRRYATRNGDFGSGSSRHTLTPPSAQMPSALELRVPAARELRHGPDESQTALTPPRPRGPEESATAVMSPLPRAPSLAMEDGTATARAPEGLREGRGASAERPTRVSAPPERASAPPAAFAAWPGSDERVSGIDGTGPDLVLHDPTVGDAPRPDLTARDPAPRAASDADPTERPTRTAPRRPPADAELGEFGGSPTSFTGHLAHPGAGDFDSTKLSDFGLTPTDDHLPTAVDRRAPSRRPPEPVPLVSPGDTLPMRAPDDTLVGPLSPLRAASIQGGLATRVLPAPPAVDLRAQVVTEVGPPASQRPRRARKLTRSAVVMLVISAAVVGLTWATLAWVDAGRDEVVMVSDPAPVVRATPAPAAVPSAPTAVPSAPTADPTLTAPAASPTPEGPLLAPTLRSGEEPAEIGARPEAPSRSVAARPRPRPRPARAERPERRRPAERAGAVATEAQPLEDEDAAEVEIARDDVPTTTYRAVDASRARLEALIDRASKLRAARPEHASALEKMIADASAWLTASDAARLGAAADQLETRLSGL